MKGLGTFVFFFKKVERSNEKMFRRNFSISQLVVMFDIRYFGVNSSSLGCPLNKAPYPFTGTSPGHTLLGCLHHHWAGITWSKARLVKKRKNQLPMRERRLKVTRFAFRCKKATGITIQPGYYFDTVLCRDMAFRLVPIRKF